MNIELILSPMLYDSRLLKEHHATVAVDVLRATTAICTAFQRGAVQVVPLDNMDVLPEYLRQGYQVACERNGQKMPGATLGNSPTEYMTKQLKGEKIAFSTTNGTVSITKAIESDWLSIGCFANISALAQTLLSFKGDVVILCSGWKGDPSIEDTLFAGALIERLKRDDVKLVNDAAMMAQDLWQVAKSNLYGYCLKATHVQRLQRLNYDSDIRFALQLDTCPVVPFYDKQNKTLHL
jgi:2-phosphosulfolactate phosphatase